MRSSRSWEGIKLNTCYHSVQNPKPYSILPNKLIPKYTKVCFLLLYMNRLCSLVVRVPTYSCRDPGFDSRRYQII
jgi:hypothetical protein